jgi:imidazolonepropionase-like amidohydrolase
MVRPLALCVIAAVALVWPADAARQRQAVLIRNATIYPISSPPIPAGSILVEDGRIRAVGPELSAPPGAAIVDASGLHALPGLIDTHSHAGVGSWPTVAGNRDGSEATDPITAHVRAVDSFNIDDPALARIVAGGVTTLQVFPGSSNLVGGEGLIVKLKIGRVLDDMLVPGAPRLMKMALGENPPATYSRQNRMPTTRMGSYAVLRDAFQRAREYREAWDRGNAQPAAPRAPAPARGPRLGPLAEILRGRMRVHVHCYRQDEFLNMYRVADEFGFAITSFQHAMEAYKIPGELARRGTAVSLFSDSFGRKIEHMAHIPQNAAFLHASGILVALHSDSSFRAQRMNVEAAKLVRYGGISEADALKTITINAARLIGIDQQVGTLQAGKHADIVLFDRHPLDSIARVERTYIDGELVYERSRNARWLTSTDSKQDF